MDNFIPKRDTSHVAPGDVASKYSPAAYLTQLWQKAKTLHSPDHPNTLSKRRPDIGDLVLSQDNMDKEVSTLELSNNVLLNFNKNKKTKSRYLVIYIADEHHDDFVLSNVKVYAEEQDFSFGKDDYVGYTEGFVISDGQDPEQDYIISFGDTSGKKMGGYIVYDLKKPTIVYNIQVLVHKRNSFSVGHKPFISILCQSELPPMSIESYPLLKITNNVMYHEVYDGTPLENNFLSIPAHAVSLSDQDYLLKYADYHQPQNTLRGILSALPVDEPGLFNDNDVADFICAGSLPHIARYILIRRTPQNTVNSYMSFSELEVYSEGKNIAAGATVTSRTGAWYAGEEGQCLVDGTKYTNKATTAAAVQGDCWFLVDLKGEHKIDSIVLYGRNDTDDVTNMERDMTLFTLPAAALPDNITITATLMPSYPALMNTPGVLSHTWTTKNDDGQPIKKGVNNTYTLQQNPRTLAAIRRLKQFHGVTDEDARVMCGENISMLAGVNDITGEPVASQFNRLFGRQGEALLASSDVTEQRHILMTAFGVNDDGLALLTSLAAWLPTAKMTLTQISSLYAWVLLSRSLSYSLEELSILNSQVPVANASGRYFAFRSAKTWLDEQHLSVTALGVLTATPHPMSGPELDLLTDTLKRECTTKDGLTRHKLAEAVSATVGLSSGSQVDALLGWLDNNVPAGNMNSNGLMAWAGSSELNRKNKTVRYVMLRRGVVQDSPIFAVLLIEILKGTTNLAPGSTATVGDQGEYDSSSTAAHMLTITDMAEIRGSGYRSKDYTLDNAWVQIDLGGDYEIDSIRLTPEASLFEGIADCYVYVSDTDMRAWAKTSKPGDTDRRYPLIGKTGWPVLHEGRYAAQSFSLYTDAEVALYLGHLLRYTLVANALNLTENIVAALVNHPDMLDTEGRLPFSLSRLTSLSQLPLLTRRCGTQAPAFLKQLSEKTLKLSDLAQYLSVDSTALTTALPAGKTSADILTFSAVVQLVETLQLSQSTGLSLTGIAQLRALSLSSPFPVWGTTSTFLMNELPASARTSVQQNLAEELSLVLSKKLQLENNVLPAGSPKKDADYFLLDPQLSGQTLTSPLAWSIAAVQLYIDRCLNGDEPGVSSTARDDQFFEDWGRYNKRYSQWAGLQQLLWEPENFIAPSMRLSQTEAFSHLLQKLDGSALNEETAEEAFRSYLTEFEHLAEIIPVGGWHDSTAVDTGFTYLLGMMPGSSTEFYWRRLDRSKLSSNSLPIHAWSGWSKIDISANPFIQPEKRPAIGLVCLNHRLHLLWIEAVDKNNSEKTTIGGEIPVTIREYTLKSSHLSYDGSWSTPNSGVHLRGLNAGLNGIRLEYDVIPDLNLIEINSYSLDNDLVNYSRVQHGTIDRNNVYKDLELHANDRKLIGRLSSGQALSSVLTLLENDTFSVFVEFLDIRTSSLVYRIKGTATTDGTNTLLKLTERFADKLQLLDAMGVDALFSLQGYRNNNPEVNFYGALGPYYWELFYHVPLVISQRLRQVQDYTCATRWQEFVFNPAGYERVSELNVRYVLLRRNGFFDINEVKAMSGGINVAKDKNVVLGPQGKHSDPFKESNIVDENSNTDYAAKSDNPNSWIQIDLGKGFKLDSIELTPRGVITTRMTDCYVYVSDTDMSVWANNSKPGDTDRRYPLVGKTNSAAQSVAQILPVSKSLQFTSYWNPLPLESDTDWGVDGNNVIPANVTDPDVIAEGDPMHYKLATFMSCLDLLMERGDTAYRLLERDTLVEAGMWYQKVQRLLGEQSLTPVSGTTLPVVSMAKEADFKPQENEKLNGYWQQLRQRLYNLRHNLTLDGQPMNLPLFAKPANPADLLSAALAAANGLADLPGSQVGQLRFKVALEQARGLTGQLVQFGSTLLNISERQDAEAMNQMLQKQGSQLMTMSVAMQKRTLESLDADLSALQAQRAGIETRQAYYQTLYIENISGNESAALALNVVSAELLIAGGISHLAGGGLDMAPNIFGVAAGGSKWGGVANGLGSMLSNTASALSTTAGVLTQQDAFTRRRGEWKLQLDSIKSELLLLDKQVESLTIRRDAADMQMTYLQTQQQQTALQLQFLKSKFTNQQLYSWLRSRLASIFWQFYDVAVSAALRAEKSYQFETGDSSQRFIRPGNWQSSTSGLLCGESLLLALARMEESWYDWDKRTLEVMRTVSLASVLKNSQLTASPAVSGLGDALKQLLSKTSAQAGSYSWSRSDGNQILKHELKTGADSSLTCDINLAELNIPDDYPQSLGDVRRIKSISVSLPALVGPYQDIQAVLRYTGDRVLPAGCEAIAVSHGVNDNGQFQLDFNDPRYLPFEGVDLAASGGHSNGMLSLSFPNAIGKQQDLLKSLNDIILHIRYTIRK
jgi:hypothetical protein